MDNEMGRIQKERLDIFYKTVVDEEGYPTEMWLNYKGSL